MSNEVKAVVGGIGTILLITFIFFLSTLGAITQQEFRTVTSEDHIDDARMIYGNYGSSQGCTFYSQAFTGSKNGQPVRGVVCKAPFQSPILKYY